MCAEPNTAMDTNDTTDIRKLSQDTFSDPEVEG